MKKKSVAVTAVSEIAVCERRVYLRAKLGDRTTREQERSKATGNELHQRAFNQKTPATPDKRCFIATAVYGCDAPQTVRLRRFRDEALIPHLVGRWFVRVYYSTSPRIARAAEQRTWLAKAMRVGIDLVLRMMK